MHVRSAVEEHTLITTDSEGQVSYSDYVSDTSIPYEQIEQHFSNAEYIVTNLAFDDELLYERTEFGTLRTWALFTFYVSNDEYAQYTGRTVWIDVTDTDEHILRINKLAPNVWLASFEYPGTGYNFYVNKSNQWQLLTPVVTNAVYLHGIDDIQELAIATDINDDTTITIRRKL